MVDASAERLKIEGLRVGDGREGDKAAWEIWQANRLDAESRLVHTEAIKCGEAFLLVAPGEEGELPIITVEDPSQVIVAYDPASRWRRLAAFKKWQDEEGNVLATLYLPDSIHKFRSQKKHAQTYATDLSPQATDPMPMAGRNWERRDEGTVDNPLGVVPVIPMRNNPSMVGGGQSDIDRVIPLQNAVNKLWADGIIASEYQSFKQRWATGIEIPPNPDGSPGNPQAFLSSIDRIWAVGDENAKFGEFGQIDLSGYKNLIEMAVQHIAAQTRTPPHYLLGQSGAFPSGESLKSTETGLVAKVRAKQVEFGEAWEEAFRLSFQLQGDEAKAADTGAEVIWANPESRVLGETTDALIKMRTLGVPYEALWEEWGASPSQIERWRKARGLPDDPQPGATAGSPPPDEPEAVA